MADERASSTPASGIAFGLGLVAGAAIGVGLGLLFAPKSGAALRAKTAVAAGIREATRYAADA